jgi:hypothetical protein
MYDCLNNIYGSDHRPVVLSLILKQKRNAKEEEIRDGSTPSFGF